MDTTAVSSLNPILGTLSRANPSSGNAITPASGPDLDGQEVAKQTQSVSAGAQSGRALQIFRNEVTDKAPTAAGVTGAYQSVLSSEDVAVAALNVARRSTSENADISSVALLRFRQRVQSAAVVARQTVGGDADVGQLDSAIGRIESGLRSLDGDAARNVESTASVLSVESRERQRSSIRIRTQEGDIVRLNLSNSSRVRAQDVAVSDENGSASQTDVSVSSRSSVRLRVEGDLNEAEYAAIRNVLDQAETIAGEFFDGDLAAAFSLASGLEFDSGELARVNLRFRSQQVTTASYAQSVNRGEPAVPAEQPEAAVTSTGTEANNVRPAAPVSSPVVPVTVQPTIQPTANRPVTEPVAPSVPESAPRAVTRSSVSAASLQFSERQSVVSQAGDAADAGVSAPSIDFGSDSFLQFFDQLGAFLQSVADGFDRLAESLGAAAASASDAAATEASESTETKSIDADYLTYHFSQSFKLEIFKAVLQVSAPDDAGSEASSLAGKLIDGLLGAQAPETVVEV